MSNPPFRGTACKYVWGWATSKLQQGQEPDRKHHTRALPLTHKSIGYVRIRTAVMGESGSRDVRMWRTRKDEATEREGCEGAGTWKIITDERVWARGIEHRTQIGVEPVCLFIYRLCMSYYYVGPDGPDMVPTFATNSDLDVTSIWPRLKGQQVKYRTP